MAQDAKVLSAKIKKLTEERKLLNKKRKVLNRVLDDMRSTPLTTYFDRFTTEELDEQLRKGL